MARDSILLNKGGWGYCKETAAFNCGDGHRAGWTDRDVDVVSLKDAAQVGFVRRARPQPLDCGRLVSEGFRKGERKLLSIERLLSQRGNRFFDFNGVHARALSLGLD